MANKIKVLFWIRRTNPNREGEVPIMVRLTFMKERVQKATGYYVNPALWNSQRQRVKGNKNSALGFNNWLEDFNIRLAKISREENTSIHLPTILNQLFAVSTGEPMLLEYISSHNEELKSRVGKGFSYSTYEKYVFTFNKVKAFIESKLKMKDILLRDVTTKFIMDFDHYLRVNDSNQHNTAVKYCINLKRILNVAVMQGLIPQSPLNSFKTIYRDTPQVYLNEQEVKAIEESELTKSYHLLARDLFIFQCNTGLAYTDMIALKRADISEDAQGRKWIIKARQKSGIVSTIPIMPKALDILEKYRDSKLDDGLLPHYSIQKYNQYIGEVGVIAGLNKKLSSHVGRRTFGNIALAKGISLNVISKILGHSSTIITQRIYAITTQNIISNEIGKW